MAKNEKDRKRYQASFDDYLRQLGEEEPLESIIRGHLVIESLLIELIDSQLKYPSEFDASSLNFPKKIELCVAFGILEPNKKEVYLKLNTLRNRFAHRLEHKLTFEEAFDFVKLLGKLGYLFSDETIYEDFNLSQQWYGIGGILVEILNNLYFELSEILNAQGSANNRES